MDCVLYCGLALALKIKLVSGDGANCHNFDSFYDSRSVAGMFTPTKNATHM